MSHPVMDRVKLDPEKVFEVQQRAEDRLCEAESWLRADLSREDWETIAEHEERERQAKAMLQPVCVSKLQLPKIVLVQVKQSVIDRFPAEYGSYKGRTFILLGEIVQMPGHVTMMDIRSKEIIPVIHDDELEMIPPNEC